MAFDRLKVSTRLALLVGTLALLLAAGGALGLYLMHDANRVLRSVYEDRTVPAVQLGEIRALTLDSRLALKQAMLEPARADIDRQLARVEKNARRVDALWGAYLATYLTPKEQQLADAWSGAEKRFDAELLLPALNALRSGDVDGARRIEQERSRTLAAPLTDGIDALTQLQVDEARGAYDAASATYRVMLPAVVGAIATGIAFAVGFGFVLSRGLVRQLGAEPAEAAAVAERVAAGDLSRPIVLRNGDGSSLMARLKAMQDGLNQVVSEVRRSAEGVATAAQQIAQGNADLSQRTEEQASALQQTAASMEQLGAAVKHNADHAVQANELAQGASGVAQQGGAVVGQVVQTMQSIEDASRRIADIIVTIDGIAFQTNILALNAAVEAARAGEQGRGFAVVAQEVRSLAQRSADAAREIKSLITASVERVDQGAALVHRAGSTMHEVVASVRRVTDLMADISAASREQSAGVSQVGDAVSQMDHVTQQNAALVEESAAAAESLRTQAGQLLHAVQVFRTAT